MKVTKYPQSCLKIEKEGRSLLVDPGTMATAKYRLKDFGHVDAVLYTHSHADHFDVKLLPELATAAIPVYGNSNVAQSAGETKIEVIEEGEELVVVGFTVKAYTMEHCLMTNGTPADIPNTGLVIDNHLLISGDSTEDVGIEVEVVAVPIFGPDISYKDAYDLLRATKAKRALPVHYDVAGIDPTSFGLFAGMGGEPAFTTTALQNGQSADF